MNESIARELVKETFDGEFNEKSFQTFISNLLKKYTPLDKIREGEFIREAFRNYVLKYKIVGSFTDSEGKVVAVLQVILHRGASLERARTAQRNFVADYLKNHGKNAALVAFITPDQKQDWRFSLVKLEDSLEVEDGKLKTKEILTPAKRWSFLVGKNEGCHTVQSRFLSLLKAKEEPNLSELEEAFNIEKVTDEFFKKYCELFYKMKESLDEMLEKDLDLKADFEKKEISTVDFAKKTLGQMAFLYFLQKKGWFGVAPQKKWGEGAKNFLRELFNRREKYGKNFFDDVLEPLFYEALTQDRGKESIYPRLNNCRMPFLNGGLFEPMNGYAWETTHIRLPDELFSNKKNEEDEGTGILDIFDLYNFTVNENEPLEKEVAVDPEMLGKVFENLLEIKDRKSKGAFYTPREIVHYMCQESLINYLDSETNETIPREDLEFFIQKGDLIIQNDKTVREKGRETDTYKFMLPESIRTQASILDKLLADIKVCDPAVGSGAFPLGMLNEIVRARQVLAVHTKSNTSAYDLKLHTISHSIYGVDLDSGAVEIAKLRLWLALVVEETEPHPLPNLEHKIMQGNSLISEYEGIKLFDEDLLQSAEAKKGVQQQVLGLNFEKTNSEHKMKLLNEKIEDFISESQRSKKQELKESIDTLKWELIEATLEEQGREDKLEEIRGLRRKNVRPFFIWKLEFSDVFKDKGGFDVVIGNPPYIRHRDLEKEFKDYLRDTYEVGMTTADIYCYFYELSFNLLRNHGVLSFITSNKWLRAQYGTHLRQFLKQNTVIQSLIDLGGGQFETATVDTNILIFSRQKVAENHQIKHGKSIPRSSSELMSIYQKDLDLNAFSLNHQSEVSLKKKIESIGMTLEKWDDVKINYGILTGRNDIKVNNIREGVFIIDEDKRNELIRKDKNSEKILKPILRGKDISKYSYSWDNKYLVAVHYGMHKHIDEYPAIKEHLTKYQETLKSRAQVKRGDHHWIELDQNPSDRYMQELQSTKIIYPNILSTRQKIKASI